MASSACDHPPVGRPLIGLTSYLVPTRFGVWDLEAALLPAVYVNAVTQAGGRPVLLPPVGTWDAAEVADLDAVILTGGPDVDPGRYGQPALATTVAQPVRDAPELALLAAAEAAGVPVLGICRGAQVLNVARGGTLHQHVPDVLGHAEHQISAATFSDTSVSIVPRSRLAQVLGAGAVVRCYHHQAVDRLGRGLRIVATAADGTVEAVEAADPDAPFLLAVQWHPEEDPADLRLFTALIDAAAERRSARRKTAEPSAAEPSAAEHKEPTCPRPSM